MNRVEIFSQAELLLQTLTEIILATREQEFNDFNNTIAEYLGELVKERLVNIGETEMGLMSRSGPIDQAYGDATRRVQERLAAYEIQFDFRRYKNVICEDLKSLSKEVAALQDALRESRRTGKIPIKAAIEVGEQVTFQIFEVGSPRDGETEALVAIPTSQQCYLDFHTVREACEVEGEWFPFQLTYRDLEFGELVFVVDQDGSINIYTNNFPKEVLRMARHKLKWIAKNIYSQEESNPLD